jgi:glycosyltransferase involved in cell wall biosynthesis
LKPDLIHAQGTERDCAISAIFSPYPRLLTIHGNLRLIKRETGFPFLSALWFQTFLEAFAVPKFNGVVCITNYTRKAVEHEVPKTWVVPNAVDPLFFTIERKPAPVPEILVVANVDSRKNQNAFIRALDPLAKEFDFKVKFFGRCGDDAYGEEFRALLRERTWCEFGGMIERPELREQFARAAILALPTHEDNCPMVVLEAMAAGVPVVASKVGGIPDLIDGTRTGLYLDPNDAASMTNTVRSVLANLHGLGAKLAEAAKDEARMRFHPAVVAGRHVEIYRETLARRS